MADFDTDKADRQSRRMAQAVFWVILLLLVAVAVFSTWAWITRTDFGVFPPIFLAIISVILWVGIVALVVKAYRGNEQRKRVMHEE
jgi:predicted neutral ceramidase superfamily lipid hydrolase